MYGVEQKSTTSTSRRRGRPPEFDRDAVLDAAIGCFWANGVADTTIEDLERSTGIKRSTLYNSFDGKTGLHRVAAMRYVERVEEMLFEPLIDGELGVADLVDFLTRLRAQIVAGTNPSGCLIVNDMTVPDRDQAATGRYLDGLRAGLTRAVATAEERGEIETAVARSAVGPLLASTIGINLVNRSRGPETAVPMIDEVLEMIRGWASDDDSR